MHVLCDHACSSVLTCVWWSGDNLQESVPSTVWILGTKLVFVGLGGDHLYTLFNKRGSAPSHVLPVPLQEKAYLLGTSLGRN